MSGFEGWCFCGWRARLLLVGFLRGRPFDFAGEVNTGGGNPFYSASAFCVRNKMGLFLYRLDAC